MIRQPLLGLLGTLVAVGGSMLFVASVSPKTMGTWLTLCITAVIPLQFFIAVAWHHAHPRVIARLPQPWRGLAFVALFAAFGAIVSAVTIALLGGGVTPPTPFPISFVIYAVQVAIWVIIGFGGWPFTKTPPLARAVGTLVMIYAITTLLFFTLFDFGHLAGAPFYDAALDPHGAFIAWGPITFTMATVGVLLTLVYFDFLPLSLIAKRSPMLAAQPVFGLLTLLFCAVIGGAIWWVGVVALGMDLVVFLGRIDVAYVFGILMVINLFQMAPFVRLPQPWRGIVLTGSTIALAAVIYPLYEGVAYLAFGGLASGPPTYDLELWMASALLAVTFPVMTIYSGAFEFWPFAGQAGGEPEREH